MTGSTVRHYWNRFRVPASAIALMLLGGCSLPSSEMSFIPALPGFTSLPSITDILPDIGGRSCTVVSPKALRKVNWTRVPRINMRIRNDEFEPMIIQMTQGWPYVFRISNRDDRSHTFNADRFLKSMAVTRIAIDGKRQDDNCVSSVNIPAGKTAELQMVAAIDGHFEFRDSWLPAPSLLSGGPDGVIIVEERVAGIGK